MKTTFFPSKAGGKAFPGRNREKMFLPDGKGFTYKVNGIGNLQLAVFKIQATSIHKQPAITGSLKLDCPRGAEDSTVLSTAEVLQSRSLPLACAQAAPFSGQQTFSGVSRGELLFPLQHLPVKEGQLFAFVSLLHLLGSISPHPSIPILGQVPSPEGLFSFEIL